MHVAVYDKPLSPMQPANMTDQNKKTHTKSGKCDQSGISKEKIGRQSTILPCFVYPCFVLIDINQAPDGTGPRTCCNSSKLPGSSHPKTVEIFKAWLRHCFGSKGGMFWWRPGGRPAMSCFSHFWRHVHHSSPQVVPVCLHMCSIRLCPKKSNVHGSTLIFLLKISMFIAWVPTFPHHSHEKIAPIPPCSSRIHMLHASKIPIFNLYLLLNV